MTKKRESKRLPVLLVAGARPNFVKVAPLMRAFSASRCFRPVLVHTGQHYDADLSDVFFADLGIPRPGHNLGVGSGTQAEQTGRAMMGLERIVHEEEPGLIVVVGDVNSTLAGALVAAKAHVPLAHVEAGLRSFDRTMPEEVNRIVTDALADFLFTPSADAVQNLRREGRSKDRIFVVGNVMIDSLQASRRRAHGMGHPERFGLLPGGYALLTLHRPNNVDQPGPLRGWIELLEWLTRHVPVLFPAHPRTFSRLRTLGLYERLKRVPGLVLTGPLPYLEFLDLQASARMVLTDSGGVQEETTVLGVPCITLRDSTERPITVTRGTNHLAGTDPVKVRRVISTVLSQSAPRRRVPPLWDGHAAARILAILERLVRRAGGLRAQGTGRSRSTVQRPRA